MSIRKGLSKSFLKNKDNTDISNNGLSQILYKFMIIVFIGIFAFTTFISNFDSSVVLVYAALSGFVIFKLAKDNGCCFDSVSSIKLLVILSSICFVVKFLWVYFTRVEPKVDYATFYSTAVELSESWVCPNRYVALFPHILGYSTFLSLFIKIFGNSLFLAPLLNVILSVISGVLIYKIVKNIISVTAAVWAFVFWIICPSQTVYNSLTLSDPLYTTFILAYVYLITVIAKKEHSLNWIKMLLYGFLSAIILQCINVNRPIAMVLVIAMFIWIFVLRFRELFKKEFLIKWISYFAIMLTTYFLLGNLWQIYFTSRIGEAPASVPGYNIYVGFNEKAEGAWNQEDSDLLFSYSNQEGATADWAQKQMFNEAIERVTSGNINFIGLFKNKLEFFLGKDSVCVAYCQDAVRGPDFMSMLCNTFYYLTILMSILGAYKLFATSHKSAVFILPLFVIGIVCAQMLVEVAPRYHYSVIPFLIIISQFYLFDKRTDGIVD